MPRCNQLTRINTKYIPKNLEPGILYVSATYGTATHLCACGCGNKTVTPLDEIDGVVFSTLPNRGWKLTDCTMRPSIGNQQTCGAHYYITDGRIDWLN